MFKGKILAAIITAGWLAAVPAANAAKGQIAFTSSRTGNREIFVMNDDGSHPRQLTDFRTLRPGDPWKLGETYDSNPTWSPDGKRIAFVSTSSLEPEKSMVYSMTAKGAGFKELLAINVRLMDVSWSPDGKWMLAGGVHRIYLLNISGHQYRELKVFNGGGVMNPVWSRDGKKIYFIAAMADTEAYQTYVMDIDSSQNISNIKKLTSMKYPQSIGDLAISPDGKKIAFARNETGRTYLMAIMDADGSNMRSLTPPGDNYGDPTWSPDGGRIAFDYAPDGTVGENNIYVMDPNGSNKALLTTTGKGEIEPEWSPKR